jgi:hypothetical protein
MKVKQLKEWLDTLPEDKEIMIMDGFDGGGTPREINLLKASLFIEEDWVDHCNDCDGLLNEDVAVMGYGCY